MDIPPEYRISPEKNLVMHIECTKIWMKRALEKSASADIVKIAAAWERSLLEDYSLIVAKDGLSKSGE